jgi:dihydrofolate synthase/folylpolyglutamate synthase
MAAIIFRRRKVDVAVFEVGLGGRLDATNAVEPEISAISSISLEHTDVLGKTIREIAHEKCGIARKGKALVAGSLGSEAEEAVKRECAAIGAAPIFTDKEVFISKAQESGGRHSFLARYKGEEFGIRLSAPGRFQVSNAKVALVLCREMGVGREAIESGLASAVPKYRMQKVGRKPLVVADCCHNPEAAYALGLEVWKMPPGRKVLLFSAMKDKDYATVLSILKPHFDKAVLVELPLARAATLAQLSRAAKRADFCAVASKNPKAALGLAKRMAGAKGCVVIAGSIYLLAALFGRDKRLIAQ